MALKVRRGELKLLGVLKQRVVQLMVAGQEGSESDDEQEQSDSDDDDSIDEDDSDTDGADGAAFSGSEGAGSPTQAGAVPGSTATQSRKRQRRT